MMQFPKLTAKATENGWLEAGDLVDGHDVGQPGALNGWTRSEKRGGNDAHELEGFDFFQKRMI